MLLEGRSDLQRKYELYLNELYLNLEMKRQTFSRKVDHNSDMGIKRYIPLSLSFLEYE